MGLPAWQPTWDVGTTLEKLVNHSVLPTSHVSYHIGKPIESVVYFLKNFLLFLSSSLDAWRDLYSYVRCLYNSVYAT